MDRIYQEGRTVFKMEVVQENEYTVSIVSMRMSKLILRKSFFGGWKMPFAELVPHCVEYSLGIEIVGFSPSSGIHLARRCL